MTDSSLRSASDSSPGEPSPLQNRGVRLPDYRHENRVMGRLMMGIAQQRDRMVEAVVEALMVICDAQSAGFSVPDSEPDGMCWAVVRGRWHESQGRIMARSGSPCDLSLHRKTPILITAPSVPDAPGPAATEILVAPCPGPDQPIGTLWIVQHDDARQFDSEDLRLLNNMCRLASLAWTLRRSDPAPADETEPLTDLTWSDTGAYETIFRAERQCERVHRWERAEERLRKSEERYKDLAKQHDGQRRLFDALLDPATTIACAWDRSYRLIYANARALRRWQRRWDNVIGITSGELEADQWPALQYDADVAAVFASGQMLRGSTPRESYLLSPVVDESGVVEAVACICEALPGTAASGERLLNVAPMSVLLIDEQLRVRFINQAGCQLLGLHDDVYGIPVNQVLAQLWSPGYVAEVEWLFRHVLDTGTPYITPEHNEPRSELTSPRHYEWQAHRIPLSDGSRGVLCWLRDISGPVNWRMELERSITSAEERQRRHDDLLATLSRELRRPLDPLLDTLQRFRRTADPEEWLSAAAMIELRLHGLSEVANDLQDFVRISDGRIEPKKMAVEIARILRHAVESLHQPATNTVIDLGTIDRSLQASGDPMTLLEAFSKLVDDAVRRAGYAGAVQISARQEESDWIEVRIAGERSAEDRRQGIRVEPTLGHALGSARIVLHGGTVEDLREEVTGRFESIIRLPSFLT